MSHLSLGRRGENAAEEFLRRSGHRIVTANYTGAGGEIDLITIKKGVLYFVEVKTKSGMAYGPPSGELTSEKTARLRRTAREFIKLDGGRGRVPFYMGPFRYTRKYKSWRFCLAEVIIADGAERIAYTGIEN